MKTLSLFAAAGLLAAVMLVAPSTSLAADCFNCAKDSDGTCAGANQCRGSREECRKAGCKITGTASCSTAANVKICLRAPDWSPEPLMTPADPAEHMSIDPCP
jgi:hypothetical protein